MKMNEYSIRVLTGKPERLFALLSQSGMAVLCHEGVFLYILQGEAGGFYTMSHRPCGKSYACKHFDDDCSLRKAAERAELLLHVDGVLRHDLDTLIDALEKEVLAQSRILPAKPVSAKKEASSW